MNKQYGLRVATALGGTLALAMGMGNAQAADHLDSPSVAAMAAAGSDITDVFAFMSSDGSKLNLIMDVRSATFSDATQYVFHVGSGAAFGAAANDYRILCQFDAASAVECWAEDDVYVKGDASATTGLGSADGKLKVFAGERNDPFYFNLMGFQAVVDTVKGAAAGLTFNMAGCPGVDATTAGAIAQTLATGADDFAGATVGALVVQIDKTLVNTNGAVLSVWASTHAKN